MLRQRIADIKIVITDVDGVLTDGGMYYSEVGDELKKFNVRDGMGVALLKAAGLTVGAMTGETSTLVERRLTKIGMDFYYLGVRDKQECLAQVLLRFGSDGSAVAYVGDELNDYPLLTRVGMFVTPADACEYLRTRADQVLSTKGGDGALRETAEFLLRNAGTYEQAVQAYTQRLAQG